MKLINKTRLVVFMLILGSLFGARASNVYFADGQSNARPTWRDAAINAIRIFDPTAQIVWRVHSGTALSSWYKEDGGGNAGRQQFYLADIYNPDPSINGSLEQALVNLELSGDTSILAGFLWFQGEADAANVNYYDEFLAFRSRIAADFAVKSLPTSIAIVYDTSWPESIAIRQQQFLLGLEPDIVAYDTQFLPRADGVHLAIEDQSIAGTAMGNNLITISVPEPVYLPIVALLFLIGVFRLSVRFKAAEYRAVSSIQGKAPHS